jgi:hypothetical protein
MKKNHRASATFARLPLHLRPLFWDDDFARLSREADSDLIIGRILAAGNWEAVQWLRKVVSKQTLRIWLQRRRGAGLSSRQLRFWELVLGLPHRKVNAWLNDPRRQVWEGRRHA